MLTVVQWPFGLVVLSLVVTMTGCSGATSDRPPVAPVRGTVHYNGQPVEAATVTFASPRSPRTSTGMTNENGEFQLTTFDANDGAVVGENVVSIRRDQPASVSEVPEMNPMEYAEAMQSGRGMPGRETGSTIPARYADFEKSRLKRTVIEGEMNEFHFELTD